MSSLEEALRRTEAAAARAAKPQYPDGWRPGVDWQGTHGTITGESANGSPDWRSLLEYWQFDPDVYEVVEPVQVRTWDAIIRLPDGSNGTRRMWYHRAGLRRKRTGAPDVAELVTQIRRRRPVNLKPPKLERAYMLELNDWQLGKRGTAAAVDRIADAIDASAARARAMGPASVWLNFLGDLGENCDGHYAMQTFEVELDRREQGILTRQLARHAIDRHRDIAPMTVTTVGGNHGENRKDGQSYTSFGDNDDVAWIEEVKEACEANPAAYGHVRFLIPGPELALTVQPVPEGPIVGLAHGHQFPKGASGEAAATEWWKGQLFGGRPVGDATILVSAHRHYFAVSQRGARTWIQAPTIDSGSPWFAESYGQESVPGMLSFTVSRTGWDDIKLL